MAIQEFQQQPGFPIALRRVGKRVRVTFGGETVVDSTQAMVMAENGHQPVHYFPRCEVRMELLEKTAHSSR